MPYMEKIFPSGFPFLSRACKKPPVPVLWGSGQGKNHLLVKKRGSKLFSGKNFPKTIFPKVEKTSWEWNRFPGKKETRWFPSFSKPQGVQRVPKGWPIITPREFPPGGFLTKRGGKTPFPVNQALSWGMNLGGGP